MADASERRSTEAPHPAAAGLQDLPPEAALTRLLDAQFAAASAVRAAIPALARAATQAADALEAGGRLIYVGAGSSGLMALADGLELPGTFSIPPARTPVILAGGAELLLRLRGGGDDDLDAARADATTAGFGAGDVALAVSASGSTPYTFAVAEAARAAGAGLIGIANVAGAPLLALATTPVLLDTGPEVVAGSTRMGAGTAQKIALNMFSTLMALRLGHVHEGRMVALEPDNAKLRNRAAGIVADLTAAPAETARAALEAAGGAVKPATLIAAGASRAEAEALLAESRGRLGPALAKLRDATTDTRAEGPPTGDDQ